MALPVIPNTYRCAVSYHIGTAPLANVFHVINGGNDPAFVAGAIESAYEETNSLPDLQTTDVQYDNVTVTLLDGGTASNVHDLSSVTGVDSGSPAPVQCCMLVTFYTAAIGRSARGRFYLGGVRNSFLTDDGTKWTTDALAITADRFATFRDSLLANTIEMAVASYTLESVQIVNQMTPRAYIGTQRRRAESQE